jgi:hypothetical protein
MQYYNNEGYYNNVKINEEDEINEDNLNEDKIKRNILHKYNERKICVDECLKILKIYENKNRKKHVDNCLELFRILKRKMSNIDNDNIEKKDDKQLIEIKKKLNNNDKLKQCELRNENIINNVLSYGILFELIINKKKIKYNCEIMKMEILPKSLNDNTQIIINNKILKEENVKMYLQMSKMYLEQFEEYTNITVGKLLEIINNEKIIQQNKYMNYVEYIDPYEEIIKSILEEKYFTSEKLIENTKESNIYRNFDDIIHYNEQLIEKLPDFIGEDFDCPLCLDLMAKPYILSCGHSYCMKCTESIIAKTENCVCALCQKKHNLPQINANFSLLKMFDIFVKNLNMICPYNKFGCQWIGKVSNIHNHIIYDCDNTTKTCKYCDIPMERKYLKDHLIKDCQYKLKKCPDCLAYYFETYKNTHNKYCKKYTKCNVCKNTYYVKYKKIHDFMCIKQKIKKSIINDHELYKLKNKNEIIESM